MSFSLRPAAPADIPAITAIYAHAVTHGTASFELGPPDEEEMARRMAALLEGGFPYLVATRDGAVLGYAYAGPYRPRPAYRNTVENSIYVSPDARRLGVARTLLTALIGECEARGFRQMVAVIGDRESRASLGLHESLGFRLIGIAEAVGYKHGRWLDQILMQKTLGAGSAEPPAVSP